MERFTPLRIVGLALVLALALAACGQHAGVHQAGGSFVNGPGGVTGPGGVGTGPGGVGTGPGGVGTGPGGVTGPGGGSGPGTGTGPGGPTGPVVGGQGDRTGIDVSKGTITIGLHAPLTGAAPVSPVAFNKGKDLYWRWLKEIKGSKVWGKFDVRVVFRNDEYTPTTAVAVCNQMATSDRAFLLIGGAGTDQINACGQYAEPRGIPYLSPGVQESGLNELETYFAVTMTYRAQMGLLVQLLKREASKRNLDKYGGINGGDGRIKLGFVRPNTPNFNDASSALRAAVGAAGWGYKEYAVVKEGSSGEAKTVAQLAEQDGMDILLPITAPTFTTQLAINADSNGYKPQWAGVAISNNINQFLGTACGRDPTPRDNTLQGALFFSPWGGWKQVMSGKYDKDFAVAANRFAPDVNTTGKGGDILLALWGIMKAVHQMFERVGPTMSRQSFVSTIRNGFQLKTGLFPDLRYAPNDPFGAQNVHVLIANCDEPGDGDKVARGAQWVDHPDYLGLRSSF